MPTQATFRRRGLMFRAMQGMLGLSLLQVSGHQALAQNVPDAMPLEQARDEILAGRVVLIDIREPAEHATGVAPGAKLLPMSQLGSRLAEIPTTPERPVLLICNTQNRSSAVLKKLREQGYAHVRYVSGGMSEWNRKGLPTVKP